MIDLKWQWHVLGLSTLCFHVWVKGSQRLASPAGAVERGCWSGQKERSVKDRVCKHLREKRSSPSPFFIIYRCFMHNFKRLARDYSIFSSARLKFRCVDDLREGKMEKTLRVFCERQPKNWCKSLCLLKKLSSSNVAVKGGTGCVACAERPVLPPGAAARACSYCPSTIAGSGTHQHQLITPSHCTDKLDWPRSIALMKCHLLQSHPLSEARW